MENYKQRIADKILDKKLKGKGAVVIQGPKWCGKTTTSIRDLRVYAESINGNVYHYRDSSGLECDAVIHLRNGSYGLIEIKLGGDNLINEGANNLKKVASKIDTTKMKNPSFLMVLTATGKYSYKREDGVYVVPIGCLKN